MASPNYPIETPEAIKFWGSRHKCNRMKSIIAFSYNLRNANEILKRYGYKLQWRNRAINAFGQYVNHPDMTDIPFSELITPWWECMRPVDPELNCYIVTEDNVYVITEDGQQLLAENCGDIGNIIKSEDGKSLMTEDGSIIYAEEV